MMNCRHGKSNYTSSLTQYKLFLTYVLNIHNTHVHVLYFTGGNVIEYYNMYIFNFIVTSLRLFCHNAFC